MKHPILRVKNVLDVDNFFMDDLEKLGRDIIALLPKDILPVDFEWCGDYANGGAWLHSDVDVALAMKDWNGQIILRRLFETNPLVIRKVNQLKTDFNNKWKIVRIDLGVIVPDNKQTAEADGWAVYSVFERKLYGTQTDLTKQWLGFSPYQQKYILRPYDLKGVAVASKYEVPYYKNFVAKWAYDEWDKDGTTDKWRKIYGDKFIEYKVLPDGSLRE